MASDTAYCFRMHRFFRNLGLSCALFFVFIGVGLTIPIYFNFDGNLAHPELTALAFGLVWIAFISLGGFIFLGYHKFRLFANARSLRQIGVLTGRQIELNQITEMRWLRVPISGSVQLVGNGVKMTVEFLVLHRIPQIQVIAILRKCVSEDRQVGCEEFREQVVCAGLLFGRKW